MTTKKFWCHYIGSDGNTPKRRNIELTDIHELLPSISNEGAKTPLWYEKEDDYYIIYAQLSDKVAVMISSLYTVSDRMLQEYLLKTDEDIDREYEEHIAKCYSEESMKYHPMTPEKIAECKASWRQTYDDKKKYRDARFAMIRSYQDYDNYVWVRDAEKNKLVVGTQCRILYQDAMGRMNIALKFNEMVRNGEIGPVILGRDHHDTGGTDAPFRETSNIKDGSNIMADMATQCYAGNAARGMSLIALHNGGGVGVGKAINGGFGMVLDGSERVDTILRMSMPWDTMVGVARRAWARNENALTTAAEYNSLYAGQDHITLPYLADDAVIAKAMEEIK